MHLVSKGLICRGLLKVYCGEKVHRWNIREMRLCFFLSILLVS